ncbi:MAG: YraN family protein [Ignavibacteriales bacterium]|nr:YraN family protein [Ignavibacteriales bacterium]
MNRRRQGALGEALAVEYLKKKGYRILRQNYRYKRDEIDIIAQEKEVLVFVEVKARRSTEFGEPIEAVTESKQKTIRAVADGYLTEHEIEDTECRFDVISILYKNGKPEIEHFIEAF